MVSVETMVKQLRNSVMVQLFGARLPMNQPTPDPSQEGNSAGVPDIDSPPPEGLGVGSCPNACGKTKGLPMNHPAPGLRPSSPLRGERDGVSPPCRTST